MTQAFEKIAKPDMTLKPEERLALTTTLDRSLDDDIRANALCQTVQEGIAAIDSSDSVSINSPEDLDNLLNECLAVARKQVHLEEK